MAENSSTRWMPTAGGVLNVVSGVFGLIGSLFLVFFGVFIREFVSQYYLDYGVYGGMDNFPGAFLWFIGIVVALLSIMALIGGIFAAQRKNWGLALAGSICAILQGGILGVISTVFIAMSRKEFTG